jgi:DNA-damage-inducible protein D
MAIENKIVLFEDQQIRRVWHDEQWYFVINDVIQILAETKYPKQYLTKLRKSDPELFKGGNEIGYSLAVDTEGGKQKMNCANLQGIFRLIMSVSSPKAEPFKQWLAQVGQQTIQETENPELLTERQAELYRAKGYSEEWIARRVQTIETRKELTDEWQKRGVKDNQEFAILTATIAKGTFGIAPNEHKDIKGLAKQNLRDHMTPLELAFTALSEEITRTVTIRDDAQGFNESLDAAIEGGSIAGEARENTEKRLGQKVVSPANYLGLLGEEKEPPQ